MAVPTTAHLTIAGIGIASAGGLAYGGYVVFKDNPRPVTELLKGREFLNKEGDVDDWKRNWAQYIAAHTTTKTIDEPAGTPSPAGAAPKSPQRTTRKTETVIAEKDIWELNDWETSKKDDKNVPESFKNKCGDWKIKKLSGTWTTEYQNIEKYCTKTVQTETD